MQVMSYILNILLVDALIMKLTVLKAIIGLRDVLESLDHTSSGCRVMYKSLITLSNPAAVSVPVWAHSHAYNSRLV